MADFNNSSSRQRPIVLVSCLPADGHTLPLLQMADYLAGRGWDVACLVGQKFEAHARRIGEDFFVSSWNDNPELFKKQAALNTRAEVLAFAMKHVFLDRMPVKHEELKNALAEVRKRHPGREVLVLQDNFFMGALPFYFDAPLPEGFDKRPKVLSICPAPLMIDSVDTAPAGEGLPPDSSPEGRKRNLQLWKEVFEEPGPYPSVGPHALEVMAKIGAPRKAPWPVNPFDLTPIFGEDLTLMICSPSLEYPRSDLPATIRFVGGLPPKPLGEHIVYPKWWHEITDNAALPADDPKRKKIVAVTQGTANVTYTDLLFTTIRALASEADNVLLVAVLGVRGASLPESLEIPSNVRVVDYLQYDAVLQYADCFVSNAGYGGFMQSIMHGVPMVLAGRNADKPEVCMRGEWAGVAINLKTAQPSEEMVKNAVDRVLTEPKFKERTVELMKENLEMDALGRIEKIILDLYK